METVACALCASTRSRPWFTSGPWTIVRCRDCGLRYLNPRPDERECQALYTQDYFEEHGVQPRAQTAAGIEKAVADYGMRLRAVELFVRSGALLEVGAASGYFLKAAAERGWQVKGVELSPWAASYARDTLGLDVFVGALEGAGFADACFDAVCMWHVFEHVPRPLETLAEVRRVLKPGGIFIADVPNVAGLDRRLQGRAWMGWSLPYHLYHYTPKTLQAMARRAELEPVHLEFPYLSLKRMRTRGAKRDRWMTPMPPPPLDFARGGPAAPRRGDPEPVEGPRGGLAAWIGYANRRLRMRLFSGRDVRVYCRKSH